MIRTSICNDRKMAQLVRRGFKNSIFATEDLETDEWEKAGRPYSWGLVEVSGKYSCFIDSGYGRLALFYKNALLAEGKFTAIAKKAIAMDRDYYGTKGYIFTR